MEKITVNGNAYELESAEDLRMMMEQHYEDWYCVRTANRTVIFWQLDLYEDELARQDELGSTGSGGKRKEVLARIDYAISNGARVWLHDVRCRKQSMDDQRIGTQRIEHKWGHGAWAYAETEAQAWEALKSKAQKGIIWNWDPFGSEEELVMPLADLLDLLARYNPAKGLKVWFGFVKAKGQLQVQPFANSAKRRWYIEALIAGTDPFEYISEKQRQRKEDRYSAD